MEDFSIIFGKAAWRILEETTGFEPFDIDVRNRSCSVILNGTEYNITRVQYCSWHVVATGYRHVFGSQWDLLAWIGDRL